MGINLNAKVSFGLAWLICGWPPARAAAEAAAASSFLPPGATIVLITGLAGDVESEATYRDQLQAWADIALSQSPRRMVVLCDAPESFSTTNSPETRVLKADRANFLTLPKLLEEETNIVLVIAWGHGGRQGSVPVFHVRGPRLTSGDFQKVAG